MLQICWHLHRKLALAQPCKTLVEVSLDLDAPGSVGPDKDSDELRSSFKGVQSTLLAIKSTASRIEVRNN